jgi:DNA end-binding protein Ku
MALTLVEMLEEPFEPKKYRDGYREALLEMIEAKATGQEVVAAPEATLPKTVDLMAALKASLEAAKKGKPAAVTAGPAAAAKDEPEEPEKLAAAF